MTNRSLPQFVSDNDFMELIPSRTDEYLDKLEESIFDIGCKEALLVWNNTIIDGHIRYSLCHKWDIPFHVKRLHFSSRDEAISFICHEQLKRTDITGEYRKYLIGKLFCADMNTACATYKKEHPEAAETSNGRISQKYVKKTDVATVIGKQYNFGFSTVTKYHIYAQAIDEIKRKSPEIANKILYGTLRVSHENIIELARLPIEDIHGLKRLLANNSIDRIGYSQLRHELQWQRLPTGKPDSRRKKRERQSAEAGIKQIPVTDPDAELASLKFTIPSWSKTISRTMEITDFPSTTREARHEVRMQLLNLNKKINRLLLQLKEDDTDDR